MLLLDVALRNTTSRCCCLEWSDKIFSLIDAYIYIALNTIEKSSSLGVGPLGIGRLL
jgi:hypothetical protein